MEAVPPASKRARTEDANSYDALAGSKTRQCPKFFSTHGCPYGDGCYYLHYCPGGVNPLQLNASYARNPTSNLADPYGGFKTRLCNKYSTPEGCRYGEKCHFAHGEHELRKGDSSQAQQQLAYAQYQYAAPEISTLFGENSAAKIPIDASLAGAIIGRGGSNAKQIYHLTGAKVSVRDHETDPSKKNVEMEGTYEQIRQANMLVQRLLMQKDMGGSMKGTAAFTAHNYKTKTCEYITKQGTCPFGERCHFAHADHELRAPGT